jgi:hypothetical protein
MLRIPHCQGNQLTDTGKVDIITHRGEEILFLPETEMLNITSVTTAASATTTTTTTTSTSTTN